MSEPKLISPMLDRFVMGGPISDHDGVRSCPAMNEDTNARYIVKVISVPASQRQLDAMLLTGAYATKEEALSYFKTMADGVMDEVQTLKKLADLEGFIPYEDMQLVPMEDGNGYDIYLLREYTRTLARQFIKQPLTHLGAVNLGLDLCAALAVCRRSGYLYVDLKPENIFVTGDKTYKIGDLGFMGLDTLKYVSLPDKYRSVYTAPEIQDAFSSLNTTVDVYALGLVLYQAYNNGALPFTDPTAPRDDLPAPAYADYEMAEIILKACAADPAERWQDPVEMGQALVSYMQRNGVNDTPIVPVAVVTDATEETDESAQPEEDTVSDTEAEETKAEGEKDETPEEATDEEISQEDDAAVYTEDSMGNLKFLLSDDEEADTDEEAAQIDYEEVSEEVSTILAQADELAAHPVPEPAVAPEPVEIPIPQPIAEEQPADDETIAPDEEEASDDPQKDIDTEDAPQEDSTTEEGAPSEGKKKRSHWLRNTLLIVLILAVLAAGVYYYVHYYLQPVKSIQLEGNEDTLTVYIESTLDESLLVVICTDPHGKQLTAPVTDGKAVFTDLIPDTAYTVRVETESFHKLTGDTAKAYSTPIQSNIVQFNAVTGAESGSAILSFTVDGPDADEWSVIYSAEGEEEKTADFPSHMVTVNGLTVGKEYTFRLEPKKALYLSGTEQITFLASELVYAEDLMVTACNNNQLTVQWKTPEDAAVETWTVRCFNDDYNETIITSENTVTFDGLDHTQSFNVEVTAAAMSVSQRVVVPENAITVSDFTADTADLSSIQLSWNATQIPKDGWYLSYTVDGTEVQSSILCEENSASIDYQIPGAKYEFTLKDANGTVALGMPVKLTIPGEQSFSCEYDGYTVSSSDMTFSMVKKPSWKYWDRYDLLDSDYTTTFAPGVKTGFLVRLTEDYGSSRDVIHITYVVRDAQGKIVLVTQSASAWSDMWTRGYCELDIPELPNTSGEYEMQVFFNSGLAHTQPFTIAE